jgi:hypothetical protein
MFYKEVPSSSVLPVSSVQVQLNTGELESMFVNYLFSKGQPYYNTYKATLLQSNSTFLKNLFDGIDNSYKEKIKDDQTRTVLRLVISSIINQIKILEEIIGTVDNEALNAIICGVVMKQMKTIFP